MKGDDGAERSGRLWRALDWIRDLGTAGYPPRTRRRLALINVVTALVVLCASAYMVAYAAYDYAGMATIVWMIVIQNVFYAATPLFHRFGDTAAALWFSMVWLGFMSFFAYALGRDAGIHFFFIPAGAAPLLFFGLRHLIAAIGVSMLGVAAFLVAAVFFTTPALYQGASTAFVTTVYALTVPSGFFFIFIGVYYSVYLGNRAEDALEREHARSERLLDNLLPETIAERLKSEPEKIIADDLGQVTILFADIVDFTPRAAALPPPALVAFLNGVFTEFDKLAERHGLEKIKTIGDAYMAAAGMPEPRADHAEAVAEMALEMLETTARMSRETGEEVSVRIGIHTGPAVAGVIGTRKFFYDVWGDTVNTAARMESHGEPGRIQVTPETRAALGDAYVFEERGEIDVKGKGPMVTWWLTGRRG